MDYQQVLHLYSVVFVPDAVHATTKDPSQQAEILRMMVILTNKHISEKLKQHQIMQTIIENCMQINKTNK